MVIKEVINILDACLIYLIYDNQCVNLVHVVLKKKGENVIMNDKNELISTPTITRWRVCIYY